MRYERMDMVDLARKASASPLIEWAYRFAMLAGIAASLWLHSNFVSLDQFNAQEQRIRKVEDVLIENKSISLITSRHDVEIADHEARIRELERRVSFSR